jgi:hypothetical protein
MSRTVQARLDHHAERDLVLLRNEGLSKSRRRTSALRHEAEAAAADLEDLAEARRVQGELAAVAAIWADDA